MTRETKKHSAETKKTGKKRETSRVQQISFKKRSSLCALSVNNKAVRFMKFYHLLNKYTFFYLKNNNMYIFFLDKIMIFVRNVVNLPR